MLPQLHAALAADPTGVPREVAAAFRAPVHRAPVHRDGRANPVDVPDDHVPVEETVVYPSGHVARVANGRDRSFTNNRHAKAVTRLAV